MKKLLVLLMILLLSACGNEKTENSKKEKDTRTLYLVNTIKHLDESGNILSDYEYEYDESGNVLSAKITSYYDAKETVNIYSYEYTDDEIVLNASYNNGSYSDTITFDKNHRRNDLMNESSVYEYDEEGKLVGYQNSYDHTGFAVEYNEEGKVINVVSTGFDDTGRYEATDSYTYDENGNLIKIESYVDKYGDFGAEYLSYDQYGNIVEYSNIASYGAMDHSYACEYTDDKLLSKINEHFSNDLIGDSVWEFTYTEVEVSKDYELLSPIVPMLDDIGWSEIRGKNGGSFGKSLLKNVYAVLGD